MLPHSPEYSPDFSHADRPVTLFIEQTERLFEFCNKKLNCWIVDRVKKKDSASGIVCGIWSLSASFEKFSSYYQQIQPNLRDNGLTRVSLCILQRLTWVLDKINELYSVKRGLNALRGGGEYRPTSACAVCAGWHEPTELFDILAYSLMHHFETIPNPKKLKTTTEMWPLKDYKMQITQRKHCGRRWNCSFWAISPFPTMFSSCFFFFFFDVLQWVYMKERAKIFWVSKDDSISWFSRGVRQNGFYESFLRWCLILVRFITRVN